MKKELERRALGIAKKVMQQGVKNEFFDWPPICTGIIHQPKKPEFRGRI